MVCNTAFRRMRYAVRGPAYWHQRHYGEDYHARVTSAGWDLEVLGVQRQFPSLQDWQPGTDCVHIVLSGPSIGGIAAPERLTSAPTIVVNGSYRVFAAQNLQADLYVVSDIGFVRRQWDSLLLGIASAREVAVDHRVLLEIARRDPGLLARTAFRVFDNVRRPCGRSAHWWETEAPADVWREGRSRAFSQSASWGYYPSCTVAYLALQIAATQRARRIVIFGMDLCGGQRFYREQRPEKTMLEQDLDAYIIPDFTFAASILRRQGVELFNAAPASAMPAQVISKIDPDRYLESCQ